MSTVASEVTAGPQIVGVLGGSGLYEIEGFEEVRTIPLTTPFGPPSDLPLVGRLGPHTVIFIPRHGKGHRFSPSEINYRANVHALKQLGATRVLSVSAVGSLREEIAPGDFVLVDQFIDRTHLRPSTFFGGGCVGHVSFADPVCAAWAAHVARAAVAEGFAERSGGASPGEGRRLVRGGTYVCMEGPQFSTRAESHLYRSWGVSVIGMTNLQEAKLAREAEICYATVALITDKARIPADTRERLAPIICKYL